MSLQQDVRSLAEALGRSVAVDGPWIVQKCPICDIELKLMNDSSTRELLYKELFSMYDSHRCHAVPDEVAYQRAEHTFVRISEAALAMAGRDDLVARRAEVESDRLAKFVEWFEHGSRAKLGS
jgi:hypothetical protein